MSDSDTKSMAMLDSVLEALEARLPDLMPSTRGVMSAIVAYEMSELMRRVEEFSLAFDNAQIFLNKKQDAATE